jgi:hypothetical protein
MKYVWPVRVAYKYFSYYVVISVKNVKFYCAVLSSMLWSYMEEWKYIFRHFKPQHWMEVSGQLNAVAALLLGKLSSVNRRLGGAPEPLWMFWRGELLGVEPQFCGHPSHRQQGYWLHFEDMQHNLWLYFPQNAVHFIIFSFSVQIQWNLYPSFFRGLENKNDTYGKR